MIDIDRDNSFDELRDYMLYDVVRVL